MTTLSRQLATRKPTELTCFFTVSWELIDPAFGALLENDLEGDDRVALAFVRITGVAPSGESVVVDVPNPPILVYLDDNSGAAYDTLRDAFVNESVGKRLQSDASDTRRESARKQAHEEFEGMVVSHEIVERRYLQGIRAARSFVCIRCAHGWARWRMYKIAKEIKLNTADEKVDPLLYFRISNGLSASCWIQVHDAKAAVRTSKVRAQTHVIAASVSRLPEPAMSVPPLLVCSYDIECYSATGDFPKATNPVDIVTMIGCSFSRAHEPEVPARVVVFVAMPCAPVEGVEIRARSNEKEMLTDFVSYMGREHPEVWLGYNSLGFDQGYLYERMCKKAGLDIRKLGVYDYPRKSELVSKLKKDGRSMAYFAIAGAMNLDALIPISDDFKLPSYKLDAVAEYFLQMHKLDVEPSEIFHNTRPGASREEVALIAKYCAQDVKLPQLLNEKLSLLLNKLAESDVVNSTLNDLVVRGQGIKVFSYLAGLAFKENLLIDDRRFKFNFIDGKYEGAYVQEPVPADDGSCFHCDRPIVSLDVGSLYPTIMQTFNLCFWTHQQDESQNSEHPRTFEWIENGAKQRHTFDQQLPGILPCAMRKLREQRVAVRKLQKTVASDTLRYKVLEAQQLSIKVVMNSAYGTLGACERSMLANLPLAMTITYLGRCIIKECARFVEANWHGFKVIYIDTDSNYIKITHPDGLTDQTALLEYAFKMGPLMEKVVSQHIREHFGMVDAQAFVLEAEDVMWGMLQPSKKRYCYRLWKNPTTKGKLTIKGLSMKRRDQCPFFQDLLTSIIEEAIDVRQRQDAVKIIQTKLVAAFEQLRDNTVSFELLTTSKALRASYNGTPPVHFVVAEKRRARGETVRPGERVPFIFFKPLAGTVVRTQGDRAEDPKYAQEHGLKIDGGFYIDSQLTGPADQLLAPFWPGVNKLLLEWKKRCNGQLGIMDFFSKAPLAVATTAVAADATADGDANEFKRRRTCKNDFAPCEINDDSD